MCNYEKPIKTSEFANLNASFSEQGAKRGTSFGVMQLKNNNNNNETDKKKKMKYSKNNMDILVQNTEKYFSLFINLCYAYQHAYY